MIDASLHQTGSLSADLAGLVDRLAPGAERAAQVFAGSVKQAMTDQGTVATGNTMQSVAGGVDRVADGLVIWVGGSRNLHWVREGRGPGTPPPYEPIAEWARSKSAHSAAQAATPGRHAPVAHLYGGRDQAFINMAFALQRLWALKRARGGMSMAETATGGWSAHEARAVVRASIAGPPKLPPLDRVIEWMEDNGVQPTQAQAFRMLVRGIQIGIAKHGTRRFRGEVPDPVVVGINDGMREAVEALFTVGRFLQE